MWEGSLTFETPMLFAIAFLFLFKIGGFSGLMMSMAPRYRKLKPGWIRPIATR